MGAVAGFFGGLLIDVTTLDTLGVSALLLRSPATGPAATARPPAATAPTRRSSPWSSLTVAIAFAGLGLHFLLGEEVSARRALFEALLPGLALNLLLACRLGAAAGRCCRRPAGSDRVTEVRLLG